MNDAPVRIIFHVTVSALPSSTSASYRAHMSRHGHAGINTLDGIPLLRNLKRRVFLVHCAHHEAESRFSGLCPPRCDNDGAGAVRWRRRPLHRWACADAFEP
jgi:hypothetical protein